MNVNDKEIDTVKVVTGGLLTPNLVPLIRNEKGKNNVIIGVDKGGQWLLANNIIADYFIGDFDSVDESFFQLVMEKYADRVKASPREKDETDTDLAVRMAIDLNPKKIIVYGGIGSRLDHVIANIHLLLQPEKKHIPSYIVGTSNRIRLLLPDKTYTIYKSKYKYVSLIPFSEQVNGIFTKGFKYSLDGGVMQIGNPYGISNELIAENGTISIKDGILLIIESKD